MGILEKGVIQNATSAEERVQQIADLLATVPILNNIAPMIPDSPTADNSYINMYLPNGRRIYYYPAMTSTSNNMGAMCLDNPSTLLRALYGYRATYNNSMYYMKVFENGRGLFVISTGSSMTAPAFYLLWGTAANGDLYTVGPGAVSSSPSHDNMRSLIISHEFDSHASISPGSPSSSYPLQILHRQHNFLCYITADSVSLHDRLMQKMTPVKWQNVTTIINNCMTTIPLTGFFEFSNQATIINLYDIYTDAITEKKYFCLYTESGHATLMEIT